MRIKYFRIVMGAVLMNAGFMAAFLLRYGKIPARSFAPYKESWLWLTALYVICLAACGMYRGRFRSSWQLFTMVTIGTAGSTAAAIILMYVFRENWGAFPTSVFAIAAAINVPLVFKIDQWILRRIRAVRQHSIVIGKGDIKGLPRKAGIVRRVHPMEFRKIQTDWKQIDQIIVAQEIEDASLTEYLALITQRFRIDLVYTPVVYMKLINRRINGDGDHALLKTFEGKRRDAEEFFMRLIDVTLAVAGLVLLLPFLGIVALIVKTTSSGPVIYKQVRVGKDGALFTIYKFRTMYDDAEKTRGFQPASEHDKRITQIGRFLRRYRLDELPQLLNIIKGDMSFVGPRPENVFRVSLHKALQGIRLAVRPGLTGLAQIRGLYDLYPGHKLKYDYLYIQRRSLRLNLYILLNTLPVLFKKQGW